MARQEDHSATEDFLSIDCRKLARDGLLTRPYFSSIQWNRRGQVVASIDVCGSADGSFIELDHSTRSGQVRYKVQIERTPCNYGGERLWVRCPRCNRRVAKLYCYVKFRCRHCLQLNYRSQKETTGARAVRRLNKIKAKLGAPTGLIYQVCDTPPRKWMHRTTYDRLRVEAMALESSVREELHQLIASTGAWLAKRQ